MTTPTNSGGHPFAPSGPAKCCSSTPNIPPDPGDCQGESQNFPEKSENSSLPGGFAPVWRDELRLLAGLSPCAQLLYMKGRALKMAWKDRMIGPFHIRRNQWLASYKDIQDFLGWSAGGRPEKFEKTEIQSALRSLRKRGMITTEQTPRGLLITFCYCETYDKTHDRKPSQKRTAGKRAKSTQRQNVSPVAAETCDNPKDPEIHLKSTDFDPLKSTQTGDVNPANTDTYSAPGKGEIHGLQGGEIHAKNRRINNIISEASETPAYRLARLFRSHWIAQDSDSQIPDLETLARKIDADLLIAQGRTPDQIERVMNWAFDDTQVRQGSTGSFCWANAIRFGGVDTFIRKFDKIETNWKAHARTEIRTAPPILLSSGLTHRQERMLRKAGGSV